MCTNRRLSAPEALEWGLVSEVLPADGFLAAVAERAATWATMPTVAAANTKRLLEAAHTASMDEQLALEGELQGACISSEDHREGIAAFLEKRPASFKGR